MTTFFKLPLPNFDECVYLINDFINHLLIKNLSNCSINLYTNEAINLLSIIAPGQINIIYINEYILSFKKCSKSQKNSRITAIRIILKYLFKKGFENCNIKLHNVKIDSKLPKSLSLKCINGLIDNFKYKRLRHTSIWKGRRDYAILLFMYATGMRASEIVNFRLTDYDKGWIRINNAKGNKDRYVPIAKVAINALNDYLKYIPTHIKYKYDQVFITDNLVPFTRLTLNNYTNKLFGFNPHIFRHTFATHLILNGCNEYVLMDFLGHSSLSTTQIYTHIQNEHLKQIMDNCFPKLSL